ncbi:MptD family putative ECF transporter S component [Microbacterium murale]|uniref:Energy-coupling factor transport system substrate-specific component n=1 Tax=Microbacterium murale TaxID=1081040 RepID=A0ABU0P3X0_9MICO|nr:MptD family putative ECF transporter S component [Microbacterium murale]MDQ0642028.1 energy-coupling factor transport system substrate-specific component [Microbacterium murale]
MTDHTLASSTVTPAPVKTRSPFAVRFSARDLLNVAIFAVIYFVIVFAVAMLGVISPVVMLLTLPLSAIAAGIPYILFLTRVRHAGMAALFGLVVALLYLMMGQPWQSTLVTIGVSVLAELILWAGNYRSKWATIWAYTVFSAWFVGPWIPFFLDRDAYLHSGSMEGMGQEYIAAFDQLVSAPMVLGMVAATVVCGFLGALLGTRLLRKHFQRAGLA